MNARADVVTDPSLFTLIVGMFVGPESIPDEFVDPTILDRARSA